MTKFATFRNAMVAVACLCAALPTFAKDVTFGKWTISFNETTKKVNFVKDGNNVLQDVSVKYKLNSTLVESSSYANATVTESNFSDEVGRGHQVVIEYTKDGMPKISQRFCLYANNVDYFLTDATISIDGGEVSTNYIAPIFTEASNLFLPKNASNRFLTVPFDNDGFVTYGSYPFSRPTDPNSMGTGRYPRDSVSFEVTSMFNGDTQEGMVVGSVTHDTWKTGIRILGSTLSAGTINRLEVISGFTHHGTRDGVDGVVMPHGYVKGESVRSARIMVGLFSDWRTGMETYGDVNAAIAPKRPYKGPAIYGWNSWGGMEKHCNFQGCLSVSDFIKENIQDKGHFAKDGVIYVGLDSWDNMNWDEKRQFVEKCKANGQEAGVYWTPWCDWLFSETRAVEGDNGFVYGQAHLKANGKLRQNAGAACVDPTAPATLSRINYYIDKFKDCGFKYIKLDFLTNGIVEADSWYNKDITTGVQAYNYGMKYLRERCGDDIILDESIAPLFPAQYAEARRVSCDAWGEMWHTSYMMNSLSFGWWLNRVYCYNDPDHLVMGDRSEAENISRMTTAAVTGYCILGDNLSTSGSYIGTAISQQKAKKYTTYEKVNDIIAMGASFRPAYGHKLFGANNSVDLFYHEAEDSWVIAHFNYSVGDKDVTLDLTQFGIDPATIDFDKSFECWTSKPIEHSGNDIIYKSPNNMARLFRLFKK